jgi:hypothetical protein
MSYELGVKEVDMRISILAISALIIGTTTLSELAFAQPCTPPLSRTWLYVADAGTGHDTLWFGFDTTATYGLDLHLCEYEFPPVPPGGVFDVRFVNIPGREGWILRKDWARDSTGTIVATIAERRSILTR